MLDNIRIVLVATSHPGNVGAAARAMRTMGLSRLYLVTPKSFPHDEATALAAGADDVLANAVVVGDLVDALADCALALGCTARPRGVALEELAPREAAARAVAQAGAGAQVALVFGNERVGLTNDELQRCHAAVHIPADPGFSSLNLAAAVQVLSYELRIAAMGPAERPASRSAPAPQVEQDAGDADPHERPATVAELEGFFGHLADALEAIDFHKGRAPTTILRRLRRLYLRGGLTSREVLILRGILSETQRAARGKA